MNRDEFVKLYGESAVGRAFWSYHRYRLRREPPEKKYLTRESLRSVVTVEIGGCWVLKKGWTVHGGIRQLYKELIGPIPRSWDVHHECQNSVCRNPDHLLGVPKRTHIRIHRVLLRTK